MIGLATVTLLLVGCGPQGTAPAATSISEVPATTPTAVTEAPVATLTPVPPTTTPTPAPPTATPLPPLTELYLCGSQSGGQWLQEEPCFGFKATEFLWAVSTEYPSRSFDYELDGDIPGGLYEIALDLAVEEGSEGEFEISIAHVHGDARTVLAQTVVTATSTEFQRFTISVDGIDPDAQAGDRLVLMARNLSDHSNKLQFGHLDSGQCYVKVPW
jgi:hypothetical protein